MFVASAVELGLPPAVCCGGVNCVSRVIVLMIAGPSMYPYFLVGTTSVSCDPSIISDPPAARGFMMTSEGSLMTLAVRMCPVDHTRLPRVLEKF